VHAHQAGGVKLNCDLHKPDTKERQLTLNSLKPQLKSHATRQLTFLMPKQGLLPNYFSMFYVKYKKKYTQFEMGEVPARKSPLHKIISKLSEALTG